MYSNFKEQAVEFIKQAVEQHEAGNYPRAFSLYMNGLEYFRTHLKYEKDPKVKEAITQKFIEYLIRAEEIREVIDNGGAAPSSNGDAAVAARPKTKPKNGEGGDGEDSEQAKLREKPNVKWNDVAGLESAKQALQKAVILPVKFLQFFTGRLTQPNWLNAMPLDHQSVCDQEDGLCQKLDEMGIQDKDGLIGEKIDGVGEKIDVEGEKSDEDCEKNDFEGEKSDEDYKKNDFEGDVKDWGAEYEVDDMEGDESGVKEGDGGEFMGVKEGGFEEGSKWSKIEEEEEEKENGGFEVNEDEGFAGEREDMNGYGDGWDEKWNDGAGKIETNEGQRCYDDYENGGYQKQFNGEERWHSNVEGGSVGFTDGNNGSYPYPLRPDAEDCSIYMKTGACKFGSNCKFNHQLSRKNQASRDMFKQREEIFDRPGPTECKYHSTPGGCKYGKACRYNHGRPKRAVAPITEFNFLGLPMRVGERECPYYMKTSSCKYGPSCRFNHPDPTVVEGGDPASPGSIKDSIPGWSSARTFNENAPYMPVIYPPSPTAPPNGKWNEYQLYNYTLEPIVGPHFWEDAQEPMPLPPNVKTPTGRPKEKKSKKNDISADPTKLKRQNTKVHCTYCKAGGHNWRTCEARKSDEVKKAQAKGKQIEVGKTTVRCKNCNKEGHNSGTCKVGKPISNWARPPTMNNEHGQMGDQGYGKGKGKDNPTSTTGKHTKKTTRKKVIPGQSGFKPPRKT